MYQKKSRVFLFNLVGDTHLTKIVEGVEKSYRVGVQALFAFPDYGNKLMHHNFSYTVPKITVEIRHLLDLKVVTSMTLQAKQRLPLNEARQSQCYKWIETLLSLH